MIERFPPAVWMPAYQGNYRKAGRESFDLIVIHCTDGHENPRGPAEMWQEPLPKPTSAHFVVGQDGTIVQCLSIADVAYHAHAVNSRSVAIEHCARTPGELGPDDPGLKPTPVQLAASARLCLWLCRQANINPSRQVIQGHAEADPTTTHTRCPTGAGIDLDAYVGLVYALQGAPFA